MRLGSHSASATQTGKLWLTSTSRTRRGAAAADAMKQGALQQTLQRYRGNAAAEKVRRSRSADFV
jgi:hypothetical protein